jgi:hypothetical protein
MADKETFCLDVFGAFGARDIAIFSKRKGTHVILIDNVT